MGGQTIVHLIFNSLPHQLPRIDRIRMGKRVDSFMESVKEVFGGFSIFVMSSLLIGIILTI